MARELRGGSYASELAPNGWVTGSEWDWAALYNEIVDTAIAGEFTIMLIIVGTSTEWVARERWMVSSAATGSKRPTKTWLPPHIVTPNVAAASGRRVYIGDLWGRQWKFLTAAPDKPLPVADLGTDQPVATANAGTPRRRGCRAATARKPNGM